LQATLVTSVTNYKTTGKYRKYNYMFRADGPEASPSSFEYVA